MNKSELKAIFINAKATDAKYIGVSIPNRGQQSTGNYHQSESEF